MNKSDILYLNPNYLIRHDETRSLLWARDEPKPVHAYSNNFHAFIHPYYAELLALFNGGNAIEHALTQSHLGQTCGEKILGFIEKITENEKFYSSECNGTKFVFPKNLLIHKKENEEIQKQNGSTDFSFQELDFRTQKLNFPLYITYMVNTVCYTDCIYCYADCRERKKRQIPMERVRALLDEIEQHPILSFTIMGGEFFLEEHWEEILSRLHTLQLYPTISTKIPISEAVIRKLRRLNVDKIQISLDTVNPVLLNRLLKVNGERYLRDMERTFALLKEYGINPMIADPTADVTEAKRLYGVDFVDMDVIKDMDAVVLAVAHTEFSAFNREQIDSFFGEGTKVLLDLKGMLNRKEYEQAGYSYWRL